MLFFGWNPPIPYFQQSGYVISQGRGVGVRANLTKCSHGRAGRYVIILIDASPPPQLWSRFRKQPGWVFWQALGTYEPSYVPCVIQKPLWQTTSSALWESHGNYWSEHTQFKHVMSHELGIAHHTIILFIFYLKVSGFLIVKNPRILFLA